MWGFTLKAMQFPNYQDKLEAHYINIIFFYSSPYKTQFHSFCLCNFWLSNFEQRLKLKKKVEIMFEFTSSPILHCSKLKGVEILNQNFKLISGLDGFNMTINEKLEYYYFTFANLL